MAAKKTRVVLAVETTTSDGKTYVNGDTASLDSAEARSLIFRGRARIAETKTPSSTTDAPIVVGSADQE